MGYNYNNFNFNGYKGSDNMTTIQIINYGAVEFHVSEYGNENGILRYRDVGSNDGWKYGGLIRNAKDMDISDIVEGYLIPTLGCDESWLEIDDIPPKVKTEGSFITDEAKMRDFLTISKGEFLQSYSYLTEEEYNATYDAVMSLIGKSIGWESTIAQELGCKYRLAGGCPYNNGDGFTCTNHGDAGTLPCEQ